jgi:hypothetical protein
MTQVGDIEARCFNIFFPNANISTAVAQIPGISCDRESDLDPRHFLYIYFQEVLANFKYLFFVLVMNITLFNACLSRREGIFNLFLLSAHRTILPSTKRQKLQAL